MHWKKKWGRTLTAAGIPWTEESVGWERNRFGAREILAAETAPEHDAAARAAIKTAKAKSAARNTPEARAKREEARMIRSAAAAKARGDFAEEALRDAGITDEESILGGRYCAGTRSPLWMAWMGYTEGEEVTLEEYAERAGEAHHRHCHTDYDAFLNAGASRAEAREAVKYR